MDIKSQPPTTPTTTIKTLDRDHRIQPTTTVKDVPPQLTNGVLKRLKPRLHYMNPVVTYRECLKNHAATMGGHAVDGCGEFMPSLTSSPSDPTSLKCAACGCHRNFHRREPDGLFPNNPGPPVQQHVIEYQPHHRHHPPPPPPQPISLTGARETSISPPDSPSPPPISSSYYPSAPHMLLALSSPEKAQYSPIPIAGGLIGSHSNSAGTKRFRTKFTQEQKEKMHELAERVGWKMQKKDEELIIGFCNEIGVDKGVFKVWMHNNKMTFGSKKDSDNHHIGNGSSVGGNGVDFFLNRNNNQQQQQQQQQQKDSDNHHNDSISSGGGNANGSSSSS